jgi:hypothetical protein
MNNKIDIMKRIKTVIMLVVLTSVLSTISCTKEGKQGEIGPTGASGQSGPPARTFNFNLTFNSGDTFKSYGGITGYNTDDVVLYFIFYETLASTNYWVGIPLNIPPYNFVPEFSDQSGYTFINVLKSDGTAGSPITSTTTFSFKAVLISSSQRLAHPNLDYTSYYEVKEAFNLKD